MYTIYTYAIVYRLQLQIRYAREHSFQLKHQKRFEQNQHITGLMRTTLELKSKQGKVYEVSLTQTLSNHGNGTTTLFNKNYKNILRNVKLSKMFHIARQNRSFYPRSHLIIAENIYLLGHCPVQYCTCRHSYDDQTQNNFFSL